MSSILGKCALAATLATTLIASSFAVVAPASAQSVELRIGSNGVRPVIRENDRRHDRGCSPNQARAAAVQEGLRRAQVVRVTDRSITVRGYTRRGGAEQLRFANRRGCPLI